MAKNCPECGKVDDGSHACHGVIISESRMKHTPALVEKHELEIKQTEALATLASGVKEIATFLTGGGLTELLSGYARSQAVKDILGGLAAHDGRNALDARVLGQNALEITEAIEKVYEKYAERRAEKDRDTEVKDGESQFREWVAKQEKKSGD